RERLDDEERGMWSTFIVASRMRTPKMVSSAMQAAQTRIAETIDSLTEDYKKYRGDDDPAGPIEWLEKYRPGWVESFGKRVLARFIAKSETAAEVLKLNWMILDLHRSSVPLLTSDHPCVYTTGTSDPSCAIGLPLSPQHAF